IQMKPADHRRVARSERLDLDIGELQCPHLLARLVALQIPCQHLRMALSNRLTHESCRFGLVVAFHETANIAAVPCGYLLVEHVPDFLVRRGSQQRQCYQQTNESAHRQQCMPKSCRALQRAASALVRPGAWFSGWLFHRTVLRKCEIIPPFALQYC